jgi:hypothetical protein
MWHLKRHLGIFLAATSILSPLGGYAQDATPGRERPNAVAERREESIRIQVNINLFFPGPTGESAEAVKLRERVRRSVYEMAAGECDLVEQTLAKTCRLESVNVNINRQAGQAEGYAAAGTFVMRTPLK